jgi:Fe-S cluster biosynthesis and repair protein YggX
MAGESGGAEATVACARCGRQAPRQSRAPFPGELGEELLREICADCWAEWQQAEVMVINELQLNFMDPRAQEVLVRHMREFLGLDPVSGG